MPWNKSENGVPLQRRALQKRATLLNHERIKRNVIVIGASAGGVAALMELFASLPPRLQAVIGVVLHRGAMPSDLAQVLGRRSPWPVIEPERRMAMKRRVIYLAPADHHLLFETGRVMILRGPKEHSTRPAIDPLFRSAAAAYGRRVVGVQLTGSGEDGVSGLLHIHAAAGLAIAQDPNDAYMPYMPLNALRFDHIDIMAPIRLMASVIAALVRGEAVRTNSEKAAFR